MGNYSTEAKPDSYSTCQPFVMYSWAMISCTTPHAHIAHILPTPSPTQSPYQGKSIVRSTDQHNIMLHI